jgi:bacillolysin
LTEAKALSSALKYVKADQYRWQIPAEEASLKLRKKDSSASYYPNGEIVICYDYLKTHSYRLAYKYYISAYLPVSSNYVNVDALNGSIVAVQNLLYDVNVTTTVATKYRGSQTITTDQFVSGGTSEYRLV